ncbi:uncharacterized protein RJT21DRAFT_130974 [Scheffersomyces amazonensis]|uniref:uncharacterized protein n=1 Tax=Scheffersomyces amazonensis TaxID=1078765 RepID=UPI00315C9FC5
MPSNKTCSFDSLRYPLHDLDSNSLNPCFIYSVNFISTFSLGCFVLFQLYKLIYKNHHGPFPINYGFGSPFKLKSVGTYQFLKLGFLFTYSLLLLVLLFMNFIPSLSSLKSLNLALSFIICTFIVLPLHIIEPTRSVVGCASLLLYWMASILFNGVILIQDIFFVNKVYISATNTSSTSIGYVIEICLFVASLVIFYLESALFEPSREFLQYYDLNHWEVSSVRNMISVVSFSWLEELIQDIYETETLETDEIPALPIELTTHVSYFRLEDKLTYLKNKYQKKVKLGDTKSQVSLFYALFLVHRFDFAKSLVMDLSEMSLGFAQAFLFQRFIEFFSASSGSEESLEIESEPPIVGFSIATGIFLCSVGRFVCLNLYFFNYFAVKAKLQGSLSNMIFRKALKLSPEARKIKSTGEVVNNLSVDVNTISEMPRFVELATAPIKLLLTLAALYKIIGIASIAGFFAACILVPASSKVSASMMGYIKKNMVVKDSRTKLTSEILTTIKSIKLYSWENPMLQRLFRLRNDSELVLQKKIGLLNSIAMYMWTIIPIFVPFSCLVTYSIVSKVALVPAICFPALTLFDILAKPILLVPELFNSFVNTKVSLKRLRDLIDLSELDENIVEQTNESLKLGDTSVIVENTTFLWSDPKEVNSFVEENVESESESKIALSDINFEAKKGQLTCIVGKVGSGKSTLLRGLLGELPILQKEYSILKVNGNIAYCSQAPWILNCSVRENILFGYRYDKTFYARTVEACQLLPDFDIIPDGDRTIVGEKGISLSGGQKARIALARAVYSRADIYLLDDVLSAVDAHVGKNIIDQVLGKNGIISSKTVILATNAVKVLHEADNIVLLKNGKIVEDGNYESVMKRGDELAELIKEFGQKEAEIEENSGIVSSIVREEENASVNSTLTENNIAILDAKNASEVINVAEVDVPLDTVESITSLRRSSIASFDHDYDQDEDPSAVRKTAHVIEKGAKGQVKLGVYWAYFKASNPWYLLIVAICIILNELGAIMAKYTLKSWSQNNLDVGETTRSQFYLTSYGLIGFIGALFTLAASLIIRTVTGIRASKYFHDTMAKRVLRSPMSFFETTPVGRILNRFSEDINVVDTFLTQLWLGVFHFGTNTFGASGVIVFNFPLMTFVLLVLLYFFNRLRLYFIPASRELKRLSSAHRSPVFAYLQESSTGIETIRAYDQIQRFVSFNEIKLDRLNNATFASLCCARWLSMRLQAISAVMIYATTLMILSTLGTSRKLDPGLVGFVMVNVLGITGSLNAMIRLWAEVETRSVSVERLLEYCELPQEAPLVINETRPRESWPEAGKIVFKNYSTKYRDNLDPVLKDLNIEIQPKEKIGIVGRTGAGKSTIAISIFRIIEPSGGYIEIDGVDTSSIGLYDLRHKLNIIPQDAQTIEGSIRENLDPFNIHSDEELWNVLEMAHLKEHIEQMKTNKEEKKGPAVTSVSDPLELAQYNIGLEATVFESGSNLSAGQKQLLSLARALLNKSQILILDEATAAVDVQTDKIIQETIRTRFKDKTILTIAHRLETILDSDRVLVLDQGQVREFDTPKNLLKDETSEFYALCKKGGYLNMLDVDEL